MTEEEEQDVVEISRTVTESLTDGGSAPDLERDDIDGINDALLALGDMLLDESGLDDVITNVLQVAMRTLGPEPDVSLTISQSQQPDKRFVTRDATSDWARELDEWQYEHGEGPCLSADERGETCVVEVCDEDERFPDFGVVAKERGVVTCISYPMLVRGRSLGSINVFYRAAVPVDDELVERGEQFARASAPLLANWLAHFRVRQLAEQLEEALEGRGVIERAKGLLMGQLGIDDERAFELLRTQSQHENIKLRLVAAKLLEQRQLG